LSRILPIAAATLLLASAPAFAHDYKAGGLTIGHPWTRPAAAGFNGAGYLSVTNRGKTADTLLGAQTTAARSIGLHQSIMTGDIASMKALPKGVVIAPGQTLTLEPGGYHFMIVRLKQAQVPGGRLPVVLNFAKAGQIKVDLAVDAAPGAATSADMGHKH
jgi:copper(I)-binding protein